jgi:hypothetical protein
VSELKQDRTKGIPSDASFGLAFWSSPLEGNSKSAQLEFNRFVLKM